MTLGAVDAAAIADQFGLGSDAVLSGPTARGELGQVWRLATERGTWAVKEHFEPQPAAEAEAHAAFQDLVRAAGVPAPAVVRTPSGDVIVPLGSSTARVYEWVDLRDADTNLDPLLVGAAVAAIHRVRAHSSEAVHRWYTEPVGATSWDELVQRSRAARAPFAEQLAVACDELVASERLLESPAALQICHCDLFADNLRSTTAGDVCIIDWENCGSADPSQELAVVLFEFGRDTTTRARALYEAYIDSGGPGRVTGRGSFSMAIAQLGHIGERACRHWLDATQTGARRAHSVEQIEEFLGAVISPALIDCLLDAIH
ncbi:MAG TPA: phosphotransferase [Ilumatobacteraceae bacterium]|jgi:Ser/Thr protein kinase RdoA (MazF antagonist)